MTGFRHGLQALAVLAVGFCNNAFSAPLTLAFDARVDNIFQSTSPDFEFPFDVAIGDTIHGQFTFEPSPVGQMGPQNLGIQFQIGGLTLESPTYDIIVAVNQYPPLGSSDLEPFDLIAVGCSLVGSTRTQCTPGTVPGQGELRWRPFIQLASEVPFLASYDVPADPSVWNQFTSRSLSLRFTTGQIGGFVGATFDAFIAVPEPTDLTYIIFLFCCATTTSRQFRCRELNYRTLDAGPSVY